MYTTANVGARALPWTTDFGTGAGKGARWRARAPDIESPAGMTNLEKEASAGTGLKCLGRCKRANKPQHVWVEQKTMNVNKEVPSDHCSLHTVHYPISITG